MPAPYAAGMTLAPDHRYLVISSDCHAGANHATYREYLEAKYHEDFDAWRAKYANPFRDLQGDGRTRNWDNDRRVSELEADGVVAEVVFPNTVPPFFPTGAVVARPPRPDEYEHRLAGIRAHNRWLADFVAAHPERRAGIGQTFLNDVDDALEDIQFIADHDLRGGLLLPMVPDDMPHLEPLFSPAYDRVWAACQDLGVILNSHSGGGGLPDYRGYPAAGALWITETTFYSQRPFTHLLWSGVFERFPRLKFVMTEQGSSWLPPLLARLDGFHKQMTGGRIGELKFGDGSTLSLMPSEYFARQCWVGASFPSPREAQAGRAFGLDKFMWGNDYPHDEGCYPNSREAMRRAFVDWTPEEIQDSLGNIIAEVYGFDLAALRPYADRCGPTVAELQEPYEGMPEGNYSPAFTRP